MKNSKAKEVLKDICDNIIDSSDKELFELEQSQLERHWFFKYDTNLSHASNMYVFYDMLKLYEHFCERWENHHHGYVCIVERVRDKYLMPKIKEFLKAGALHYSLQQAHGGSVCSQTSPKLQQEAATSPC